MKTQKVGCEVRRIVDLSLGEGTNHLLRSNLFSSIVHTRNFILSFNLFCDRNNVNN